MQSTIAASLLALAAFATGCTKNEADVIGTIAVKPAADTLYFSDDCEMRFDVTLENGGKSEPTKTQVSGLPPELTARFEKESGKPGFESAVTFLESGRLAPGNYPVNITASAASYTADAPVVVNVGKWQGYTVQGKSERTRVRHIENQYNFFNAASRPVGVPKLSISLYSKNLPATDGIYTFSLKDNGGDYAIVLLYGNDAAKEQFVSHRTSNTAQLNLTIKNGKAYFRLDNTRVINTDNGEIRTVSFDWAE